MEIIQFQEAQSHNQALKNNNDMKEPTKNTSQEFNIKSLQASLIALPNGYQINQYFQRFLVSEYLFSASIAINIMLILSYCHTVIENNILKTWFLDVGSYFNILCILILFINQKCLKDYKNSQNLHLYNRKYILLAKLIVLLIRPYSFLQNIQVTIQSIERYSYQTHNLNNVLAVFSVYQIFLFYRIFPNSSKQKNARSSRVCRMYGCEASNLYAFRVWLKEKTFLRVILMCFIWFLIFSITFRIAEYRYNDKLKQLQNSLWLTFSTMFCVGFGDVCVQTTFGRWVAITIIYSGALIIYISVTSISMTLDMNNRQKTALKILTSLQKKNQLRVCAGKYIRQSLWRIWKCKKQKKQILQSEISLKQKKLKKQFQIMKIRCKTNNYNFSLVNEFKLNFDKVYAYLSHLNQNTQNLFQYIDSNYHNEQQKLSIQNRNKNLGKQRRSKIAQNSPTIVQQLQYFS